MYRSKIKHIFIYSFVIFLLAIALGVILTKNYTEIRSIGYDLTHVLDSLIQTLGLFSLVIFVTSIILFFLREQIFHSWLRFAKWYLPIATLLILISSDSGGGLFIGFGGGYDREGMIWFTSGLFLIISLILIAVKSWKLRKADQKI